MVEFIEEWFLEQTLGEGSFGDVKLLVHRKTGDEVALKVVNIKDHPDAAEIVQKETQIHRLLTHENIVKFHGSRQEIGVEYLFLEYCSGGELYDMVEPDVGVPIPQAQSYFRQIISAVDYLHGLGITHRDIKPENILLDANGKVKLSDFGFATIFRSRGVERRLDKKCGTLPYVAPEVLVKAYKAQPADIWSCGIVLVALLAGELPWDKPIIGCAPFKSWKEGSVHGMPWDKLDLTALNFIKRILCIQVSKRITIEQILNHQWMNKKTLKCTSPQGEGNPAKKRQKGMSDANLGSLEDSISRICYSQQERFGADNNAKELDSLENIVKEDKHGFSFSQPVGEADMFFLGSQLGSSTQTKNNSPMQRWVKRMTRFFVTISVEDAIKEIVQVLDAWGYNWKVQRKPNMSITVSTVDRRKMQLIFKANVVEMGSQMVLLDFRLSRGDGLEFKRQFLKLKKSLEHIEMKGPTTWPIAIATNSIPS